MSNLLEALEKGNIKTFTKVLTDNLNEKRDISVEELSTFTEETAYHTFAETKDPEFVSEGDEFDPDAEYFYEDTDEDIDDLNEAKRVVKIDSKGGRRVKKMCGKGFKLVGNTCVKQSGQDKTTMRKSQKKRGKTLKSKGSVVKLRTRRFLKAIKKRKARGL